MPYFPMTVKYSNTYEDDQYIYRHVMLTQGIYERNGLKRTKRLYNEHQWRKLGLNMSPGWEHYMWFKAEKNLMLFRKKKKNHCPG